MCKGPCITCSFFGMGCLAGHNDDYYCLASTEKLKSRLDAPYTDEKDRKLIELAIEQNHINDEMRLLL